MSLRPRLSIEITQEQSDKLRSLFSWGQMKPFFNSLIDGLIPIIEQYGEGFMLLVVQGHLSMETLIRLFERNREAKKDED